MLKKVNVLIVGDSLVYGIGDTEKGGWVNRLRLKLEEIQNCYFDVYNLGIPDDSSLDILKRFEQEIISRYYQGKLIIIFMFGANDSSQTKTPYEVFEHRLKAIFEKAKNYTTDIAYLNIPRSIDIDVEGRLGIIAEVRNEETGIYSFCSKSVCEKNGIEYIDIRSSIFLEDLSIDGVHPNEEGHEKISNIVYDYIIENSNEYLNC